MKSIVLAALALDESAVDTEGNIVTVEDMAKEKKKQNDLLPREQ